MEQMQPAKLMQPTIGDRTVCRPLVWVPFWTLALTLAAVALPAQGLRPWERTTPASSPATLPATPPTSQTAPQSLNSLPAPIAATAVPPRTAVHRAEVTYTDGLLDVRADNSSLHQILRAISRRTGMTITGGIADERVFGNYGPATPSAVLTTLIDGTGTNMLLREGDATHPMELVLTPQVGGPPGGSQPTPIGSDADDAQDEAAPPIQQPTQQPVESLPIVQRTSALPAANGNPSPATSGAENQITNPPSIPQPLNNVNGSPANTSPTASTFPTTHSVPIDSIPTPSTTPSSSGIVDAPNPPPPGSTTSGAPAGVKTPEQIYQQLLQMQQKQQQPQSAAPNTTTPPQQ